MLKKFIFSCVAFIFLLVMALIGVVWQPVFQSRTRDVPSVSPQVLEQHVRMLSETLHPRSYDHRENLRAAADYIKDHVAASGGRIAVQTFSLDGEEYWNITASYGPETGPVLIVGAHYDSFGGYEEDLKINVHTPGADDNASGVAALLALADLLSAHPPHQRVVLVAYCLEEPPFYATDGMGSAVHAASVHAAGEQVIGMVCLEMVGCFRNEENSQTYPVDVMGLLYPTKGNFIGVVGRFQDIGLTRSVKRSMLGASDLPVYSMNAIAEVTGIDFSDHRSYWPYDIHAVMITDTAFYRNPAYHTDNDTADSLDYDRMAKVVQGVFAAVMDLTETP